MTKRFVVTPALTGEVDSKEDEEKEEDAAYFYQEEPENSNEHLLNDEESVPVPILEYSREPNRYGKDSSFTPCSCSGQGMRGSQQLLCNLQMGTPAGNISSILVIFVCTSYEPPP